MRRRKRDSIPSKYILSAISAVCVIFILLNKTEIPFIKELLMLMGIYSSILFMSIFSHSSFVGGTSPLSQYAVLPKLPSVTPAPPFSHHHCK